MTSERARETRQATDGGRNAAAAAAAMIKGRQESSGAVWECASARDPSARRTTTEKIPQQEIIMLAHMCVSVCVWGLSLYVRDNRARGYGMCTFGGPRIYDCYLLRTR